MVTSERMTAGKLASFLSPRTWANVTDLRFDLGLTADELSKAAMFLERNGVRVFFSDMGYKASPATWQRCQRFAAVAEQ